MAKTRASDMIRLPDGDEMTLGSALGAGRVCLRTSEVRGRNSTIRIAYFARDASNAVSWEIGRTLYESRMGIPLSVGAHKASDE